ncbi:MAG: BMP family ABC transporter substrate-binding protein [Bacilli bacterium]|nr:BMP family ABC transporter substrate-binding protein [Bacilli bacterium]
MKKVLRILGLGAVTVLGTAGLSACGEEEADLTIGMVCIGDPATSTYDGNFKNGLEDTKAYYKKQGYNIKTLYKKAVGENDDAKAAAEELAEECDVVLLDSYGHQFWAGDVAKANPNVKFVSCTGDLAARDQTPNLYNAFANIYEGRYLAGIAAGMKLNAIGSTAADHVLGYVAAWPYAEVISGYTAFYLGAKSVCPDVTMKTVVTKSWGDESRETTGANKLIQAGCKVISQHADTYGAPRACNTANVPNVSYNVSANGGNLSTTYLCSSRINWTPYFNYVVDCVKENKTIAYDWTGGIKEGSVVVGDLGSCAAEGTKAAMDEAAAKIKAGTLKVFDCSKFTVSKENNPWADYEADAEGHVTSYTANVVPDTEANSYVGETEVCVNGVIEESTKRSAPYFELNIDGITCIDAGDAYNENN